MQLNYSEFIDLCCLETPDLLLLYHLYMTSGERSLGEVHTYHDRLITVSSQAALNGVSGERNEQLKTLERLLVRRYSFLIGYY